MADGEAIALDEFAPLYLASQFIRTTNIFKIPGAREPEYKFIVPEKESFRAIIATLAAHPSIKIDPVHGYKQRNDVLLSLGMDTVDADDIPTRLVQQNDYQYRVRMSYYPDARSFDRVDRIQANLKNLLNCSDGMRDEFEAMIEIGDMHGLNHGVDYLINKYKSGGPQLPSFLYDLVDHKMAVNEICMTSRAEFGFEHRVPGMNCSVRYEACTDSQLYASPSAHHFVGRDYEFETEAKYIWCPERVLSDSEKMNILIASLESVKQIILPVDKKIYLSDHSKLQRAAKAVEAYYDESPFSARSQEMGITSSDVLYSGAFALKELMRSSDKTDQLLQKEWLVNTP